MEHEKCPDGEHRNTREHGPGKQAKDEGEQVFRNESFIENLNPFRVLPYLLLIIVLSSALAVCVSGSTPPQDPALFVSVASQTIYSGSGIDISVEWNRNAALFPAPDFIDLYCYNLTDGSLLGTYTLPRTSGQSGGKIVRYSGTIPGSIIPAGTVNLEAIDPGSGAVSRVTVNILTSGESYLAYRHQQVMEGIFYPVAALLIIIFCILLAGMIIKGR
jgi:hypothetical protein